jgi:hypothetical protein
MLSFPEVSNDVNDAFTFSLGHWNTSLLEDFGTE